jgi:hypothetical protein
MMKWNDEGETLWLLTEQEYDELHDGTTLLCIDNKYYKKSPDIDRDTRFGVMGYGLTEKLIESQGLEDLVLLWRIRG